MKKPCNETVSCGTLNSMETNQSNPVEENVGAPVGGDDPPEAPAAEPEDVEAKAVLDEASLSAEARKQRWLARRPRVEHLKDGVAHVTPEAVASGTLQAPTTVPLFNVGDRIVVDVSTVLLKGEPWLYTLIGKVRSIDDDTGLVTLFDEDSDLRNPMVRYASFMDPLCIFKLAPIKGNPFLLSAARPVRPPPAPGEVRRGRGRPKGSKNRPKDVIEAEREASK
jgi:hypothetical protein